MDGVRIQGVRVSTLGANTRYPTRTQVGQKDTYSGSERESLLVFVTTAKGLLRTIISHPGWEGRSEYGDLRSCLLRNKGGISIKWDT